MGVPGSKPHSPAGEASFYLYISFGFRISSPSHQSTHNIAFQDVLPMFLMQKTCVRTFPQPFQPKFELCVFATSF